MKTTILHQPKDSQLCSAYASFFVLQDLETPCPLNTIISQLPISETYGIGLYDIALFFTQFPLNIEMNSNGDYFPKEWKNGTSSKNILKLLEKSDSLPPWQESLKDCLSREITLQRQPLSLDEFTYRYAHGWKCIAYLNSSVLYQNSTEFFGHYVYVESFRNNESTIQDSHWEHPGQKVYPSNQLLLAIHEGQDHVIWIKRP